MRTRAIPERLRGVFTTRRYTNPRLPYLTFVQCLNELCAMRSEFVISVADNKFLTASYCPFTQFRIQPVEVEGRISTGETAGLFASVLTIMSNSNYGNNTEDDVVAQL